MKRPFLFLCGLCIAGVLPACAPEPVSRAAVEPDPAEVAAGIEGVLDTYFRSINTFDLDLLLTLLADTNDVSIVTPAGRLQSLDELEGFFQILRDSYTEIGLSRSNVVIGTEGTAAWAAYDYTGDGIAPDGTPVQFDGWETQVYRLTDDGWRIAHIHYSAPPAAPEVQ